MTTETRRRTDAVTGFVNFPINDPALPSDGQGGMFVRLVVVDTAGQEEFSKRWMACCGGYQNFILDEAYIRDDVSLTQPPEEEMIGDTLYPVNPTNQDFHFPWQRQHGEIHQYESIQYLCVMTIGSTGWSNTDWTCTYNDLTDKGKQLYRLLQELYPGCTICLQTWLDT